MVFDFFVVFVFWFDFVVVYNYNMNKECITAKTTARTK